MKIPRYTNFRLHSIPQFFRSALLKWGKAHDMYDPEIAQHIRYQCQQLASIALGNALDHHGAAVLPDGKRCFVTQPYCVTGEKLQRCEALAKEMGLRCELHPYSAWNCGETFSIVFYEGSE